MYGTIINVIGSHLKAFSGSENEQIREWEQEGIINYIDNLGSTPIIYLGDLNSFSPEDWGLNYLQSRLGYGPLSHILGSFASGWLGQRFQLKNVFLAQIIVYIGITLLFLANPFSSLPMIYVMSLIIGIIANALIATQIRLIMEYSHGKTAGMSFSWFMSMGNLGMLIIGANLIANLQAFTDSYLIGMQAQVVLMIISIPLGYLLIKKMTSEKK